MILVALKRCKQRCMLASYRADRVAGPELGRAAIAYNRVAQVARRWLSE